MEIAATQKNDEVKSPESTTIEEIGPEEIYPELIAFAEATNGYRLPINWNKVAILVKKHDTSIRSLKNHASEVPRRTICKRQR